MSVMLEYCIQKPITDTLTDLSFSSKNNYKSFDNCKFLS